MSFYKGASLVAQRLKRLPAMRETWVVSLGWENPLEKEMANHSTILAWRIPWMEEPGGLESTGSQRVGHDWATSLHFTSNLTPTFISGNHKFVFSVCGYISVLCMSSFVSFFFWNSKYKWYWVSDVISTWHAENMTCLERGIYFNVAH